MWLTAYSRWPGNPAARKLKAIDVHNRRICPNLFILRGVPGHIRSDNLQFRSQGLCRSGLQRSVQRPPTSPGSPWENGYVESFNARLRDELLDGEIFYTLREAQIVIESWRRHYNTIRPHASLGYKPPAPRSSSRHSPRGRLRYANQVC